MNTVNNQITYQEITYNLHGLMNCKFEIWVHAHDLQDLPITCLTNTRLIQNLLITCTRPT